MARICAELAVAIAASCGFGSCGSGSDAHLTSAPNKLLELPYQMALSSGTGNYPAGAIGDVTLDGIPDALITGSSSINVFKGLGNGFFDLVPLTYSVGSSPSAIAVSNLTNNGINDIVVANENSSTVSVLIGLSSGGFAPAVSYSVGANPIRMVVLDVNGDGYPDIITANGGGANVSVLLAKGDGTFNAAVNYATTQGPVDLCVVDFNNDGLYDIGVAYASESIGTLLGQGSGTFGPVAISQSVGSSGVAMACGDFNRDGSKDVAIFSSNGGTLNGSADIFLGYGNGTFKAPSPSGFFLASNPNALGCTAYAMDVNHDGILDLVVSNTFVNANSGTDGAVSVLTGIGDGTFNSMTLYPAGMAISGLAEGDINQDGYPDFIGIPSNSNYFSVLLGH